MNITRLLHRSYFQIIVFLTFGIGSILMFSRIITNTQFSALVPYWYDVIIFLGGFYGGALLLTSLKKTKIIYKNNIDKIIFYITAIHLLAASIGHLVMLISQNHELLDLIPLSVVYLLLIEMVFLSLFSFRIKISRETTTSF